MNPLITPSASPPVAGFLAPPSPSKRQRLTPASRSASFPFFSASREPEFDLHGARRDSSRRVLDVWSQLAERYTRRLDQDDIVDLGSVTVVKDRGVLRRSGQFDFGCFAETDDASNNDCSSEGAVDDDFDELDAFAIENNISSEVEKNLTRNIQPVQVMDPADAEDLQEFLEAEDRRKDLCGDEADLSSDDPQSESDEFEDDLDDDNEDDAHGGSPLRDRDPSETRSDSDELQLLERQEVMRILPTALVEQGSDDELGTWDVNEGNTVYQLAMESDRESEANIIDPSPQSSPVTRSRSKSLQRPSASAERKAKSKNKADALSKKKATPTSSPRIRHSQLQTPPQSSSSVTENTPDSFIPSLSPPNIRLKPRPVSKGAKNTSALKSNFPQAPDKITKPQNGVLKPRMKAGSPIVRKSSREVVKQQDKGRVAHPQREGPATPVEPHSESASPIQRKQSSVVRRKSKSDAAIPERTPSAESDDPIDLLSSPEPQLKRSWSRNPPEVVITSKPTQTRSSKGRKRKRAASSLDPPERNIPDSANSPPPSSHPQFDRYDGDMLPSASSSKPADFLLKKRSNAHTKPPQGDQPQYHSFSDTSSDSLLDCYPYSDPYTLQGHDTHPHRPPPYNPPPSFDPFQDPRAQLIISQAMQQLTRLATGMIPGPADSQQSYNHSQGERRPPAYQQPPYFPYQNTQWGPYTPTHHSHQPYGSSSSRSIERPSLSSVNSTPSHPHPYPHSFAPSSSGGTFPPSSPEPFSSPPRFAADPSTPHRRATSLVRRSQSRGRRVSFRLEGEEFMLGGSQPAPSEEDNPRNGLDRRAVAKHSGSNSRPGPGEVKANSSRASMSRDARQATPSQERTKRNKSPYAERSFMQSPLKSKGKPRAELRHNGRVYNSGESDVESYSPPATTRGKFARGQTPGPPSHPASPQARSGSRSRSVIRHEKGCSKSVRSSS